MITNYPWKRLWSPRPVTFGYDEKGFVKNKVAGSSLDELDEIPCVILLGDPGMGKSTEIKNEASIKREQGIKLFLSLNGSSSESQIIRCIERQHEFQNWIKGDEVLFLYLDALDEGLLTLDTLFHVIINWLDEHQTKFGINIKQENSGSKEDTVEKTKRELRLRIGCRTAIWHSENEKELEYIFGKDNFKVYELAPLQQGDIRIAAELEKLNPDSFLDIVSAADFTTFASDPVSLKFLITSFKEGKLHKDSNKAQVYHDGLHYLSTEINPYYKKYEKLGAEQRLRIASRIAVYTIFSNTHSLIKQVEINLYQDDDDNLLPDHLVGDSFKIEDIHEERIDLPNLQEILNTGLFSLGANEKEMVWKHRTYPEFLAAWHLQHANIDNKQILQLISAPADKNKISPQLQETALWLAYFNRKIFEKLKEFEPLLLLRGKGKLTEDDKQYLTERILLLCSKNELRPAYNDYKNLSKLCHSSIGEQIDQYVADKHQNLVLRRVVLTIAEGCKLEPLEEKLIKVLSDKEEHLYLRRKAVEALGSFINPKIVELLRPYALEPQIEDTDDELKAHALFVLYPTHLSTDEVLKSLTVPKARNLYGFYKSFIDFFSEKLPEEDLSVALEAILIQDHFFDGYDHNDFYRLINSIVERAWNAQSKAAINEPLARIIIRLIEKHAQILPPQNDEFRLEIALMILDAFKGDEDRLFLLLNSKLIQQNDWKRLCQIIDNEQKEIEFRKAAGFFLFYLREISNREYVDKLIELTYKYEWFNQEYGFSLRECDLSDERSLRAKESFDKSKKLEKKLMVQKENEQLKYHPLEKSLSYLDAFENGSLDGWWRMLYFMQQHEDINRRKSDYDFNIKKLPVWEELSKEDQERVVEGCMKYLDEFELVNDKQFNRPKLAGFRALLLTYEEHQEFIVGNQELLIKWAPVIIHYCLMGFESDLSVSNYLFQKSYESGQENFIGLLKEEINSNKGYLTVEKLKLIFDDKVKGILKEVLNENLLGEVPRSRIIHLLYEHDSDFVHQEIIKEIEKFGQEDFKEEKVKELFFIALKTIKQPSLIDQIWDILWPYIESNVHFGKSLMESIFNNYHFDHNALYYLSPGMKARFLLWIFQHYPIQKENDEDTGQIMNAVDHIGEFRSRLLNSLIETGSKEALSALEFLVDELPEDGSVWWITEAKNYMIEKSYSPTLPKDLRKILQNSNLRLLRSSEELMEIILESLARFQLKLKGNNPTSYFLWDKLKTEKGAPKEYYPKDENAFSDFVKMHLDYDLAEKGIIINREVEIKRSTGFEDGERTDIFVQANGKDRQGRPKTYTVVIEVKGCWHYEILTAMKAQLHDTYLAEYKSNHGIFLVGWYHCDQYTKICSHTKFKEMNELKEELSKQALSLSNHINLIESTVLDCSL